MHEQNIFITPTYDDDHLPFQGQLVRKDFQDFFKRLRKKIGTRVRVLYCGEYGGETGRPHFHACIFGWEPSDGIQVTSGDKPLFESATLEKIWGRGFCRYSPEINFTNANYVAGYITKKITGELAETHYERIDPDTGEIYQLNPEFLGMSNRPGLGQPWIEKYGDDVYEKDEIVIEGKRMRPPRYYDQLYEKSNPEKFRLVRTRRAQLGRKTSVARGQGPPIAGDVVRSPNAYKGTERQKLVKQTITLKNQRERNET